MTRCGQLSWPLCHQTVRGGCAGGAGSDTKDHPAAGALQRRHRAGDTGARKGGSNTRSLAETLAHHL